MELTKADFKIANKETYKMSVAKYCLSFPDSRKASEFILEAILKFLER